MGKTIWYVLFSWIFVLTFIVGLLAVGFEKYGSEEKLKADPIRHLFDVYVGINKDANPEETEENKQIFPQLKAQGKLVHDAARTYFKRMEDGKFSVIIL